MIFLMVKDNKFIVEYPITMVHSLKVRKKDRGDINGITVNHMKANLNRIRHMGMENTKQNNMSMKGIFKMVKKVNQAF